MTDTSEKLSREHVEALHNIRVAAFIIGRDNVEDEEPIDTGETQSPK